MSREAGAPFLGVLTRPVETNYRAGGMGPPGAHVNQFADRAPPFAGPSLGAGSDGGGTGGWVKGMTDFYDNTTNGTSTYHCSQTLLNHQYGDTGKGQITFGVTPPASQPLQMDQRLHGQDMYGVSILNHLLQHDPSWRRKFGAMRDSAEVMKHFNYKGIQVPEQVDLNSFEGFGSSKPYSVENGFVIFGRVRFPNIFLAENKNKPAHVGEGMQAHLLLRRHRYVGDSALREEAWKPRDPVLVQQINRDREASISRAAAATAAAANVRPSTTHPPGGPDPDFDMTHMYPEFDSETSAPVELTTNDGKKGGGGGFGSLTKRIDWCMDGGDGDTGEEGQQYYWSFDPYVSELGTNPDPEYYINSFGRGLYINIGMVHHALRGPNNYTPYQAGLAQQALYPAQRNKDYLAALHSLDVIELMVRCAPKLT
jgi:hypothetical protein